jgi:hypothetical protein
MYLSARNRAKMKKKRIGRELAMCSQLQLGLAHQTVRWCTGQCPVRQAGQRRSGCSREKNNCGVRLKFTGLSGEPTAPAANGRLSNLRATRGPQQRSVGHTGLSGAPTDPEDQWSVAPLLERNRAPDCYSDCPVVHRTVRCTTQQKARFAFQDCLQRLLAALGL